MGRLWGPDLVFLLEIFLSELVHCKYRNQQLYVAGLLCDMIVAN